MANKISNYLGYNLVPSLTEGLYNVGSDVVTRGLTDPTQFGNWVLLKELNLTSSITSDSITYDFQKHNRIRVVFESSDNPTLAIRFNNDGNSGSYSNQNIQGLTTVVSTATTALTTSIMGGVGNGFIEIATNKAARSSFGLFRSNDTDKKITYTSGSWLNTSADISSMQIYSTGGNVTIRIYTWQDIIPTQIHSYELVKEYNLYNQTLDDAITIDGENDDLLFIEYDCITNTSNSNVYCQLNSDSTSANYTMGIISRDGSSVFGIYYGSIGGLIVSNVGATGSHITSNTKLNLKKGGYRISSSESRLYRPDNTDNNLYMCDGVWKNSAAAVTSLKLTTTSYLTGFIRIYKFVKTHLISSSPNLLTGLWSKYVDVNTIQVNPGEIEIAGVNCYLSKATNITFSSNLRSGETESATTYYYLYAIKEGGRNLSFKFSSVAPLMDRYGNTVSSFDDCDFKTSWYHPNEGLTWRYVGIVYNNASSNLVSFDKCYPGYWESVWTSFAQTDTLLNVKCGRIKTLNDLILIGSASSSGTNKAPIPSRIIDGSSVYGITQNGASTTNIAVPVTFGSTGVFNDGSWKTSGYYKVIVKE